MALLCYHGAIAVKLCCFLMLLLCDHGRIIVILLCYCYDITVLLWLHCRAAMVLL